MFEVEPIGARRSRLTHTLDTRLGWKLMPLHPVLRAAHDALLEDLLDNAERAAGGSPAPPPLLPVRIANAVEGGVIRLRRDPLGWIVPGTLVAIAALHAAWALGWRWPGGSDQALADHVISQGAELPPTGSPGWSPRCCSPARRSSAPAPAAPAGGCGSPRGPSSESHFPVSSPCERLARVGAADRVRTCFTRRAGSACR